MGLGDIVYYIGMGIWLLFYFGLCIYQTITERIDAQRKEEWFEKAAKRAVARGDDKAADAALRGLVSAKRRLKKWY